MTKYKTVEELLKHPEEATKSVGQEHVISTFDFGVRMRTLPLVWKYPEHIVFSGPFHTKMKFISMFTKKKARGSGYIEILFEAKL